MPQLMIPPDLEAMLEQAAYQQGMDVAAYTERLLRRGLEQESLYGASSSAEPPAGLAGVPDLPMPQKGPTDTSLTGINPRLAALLAAADGLEKPEAPPQNDAFGDILAEKYRKQGFRI